MKEPVLVTIRVSKAQVLLGLLFLLAGTNIALTPVASAALYCTVTTTCNSPSTTVMRLSATSNAHGELPGQSNYAQLVCCGGVSGVGNSCSGTYETVAKLHASTNSHIQMNDQSGYANNVCLSNSGGTVTVANVIGSGGWYDESWAYRKKITIDHTKVSGGADLSNFPMLFSSTSPDFRHTGSGGHMGKTDATDIVFTSSDGTTKIAHEIESYVSTTGEINAWVKIPTLSGSSDTDIYIYYGNSGASDMQTVSPTKTDVWSAYGAVWHMMDDPSVSLTDSTGNGNTGSPTNFSSGGLVAGKINGATDFDDGGNPYQTFASNASINVSTSFTVSFWFKMASGDANHRTFFTSGTQSNAWVLVKTNSDGLNFSVTGVADNFASAAIADGTWRYVTVVKDGNSGTNLSFYRDGVAMGTASVGSLNTPSGSKDLGRTGAAGPWIDEMRITSSVLPLDWTITEFNNQSATSTFYAGSTEEPYAPSVTNCDSYDTTVLTLSAATNAHGGNLSAYGSYKVCASATASSMTFTTDGASQSFPALSPGTLVSTSSILSVTLTNPTGYNVTVQRSNALATLLLTTNSSVSIPDKTAWVAPGATTTTPTPATTASTTDPLTLQFRVRQAGTNVAAYASTWWGTSDTTANAKFAGFPTTAQTIINQSIAAPSGSVSRVLYNLNVPATQQNGTYQGSITYSATANP